MVDLRLDLGQRSCVLFPEDVYSGGYNLVTGAELQDIDQGQLAQDQRDSCALQREMNHVSSKLVIGEKPAIRMFASGTDKCLPHASVEAIEQ